MRPLLSRLTAGCTLLLAALLCPLLSPPQIQAQGRDDVKRDRDDHLVRPGLRVSAYYGVCFDSGNAAESCPVFAVSVQYYFAPPADGYQRWLGPGQQHNMRYAAPAPLRRRNKHDATNLSVQATYVNAVDDKWPPPPPGGGPTPQAKSEARADGDFGHDGTQVFLLEGVLPVPVQPRFLLEPFVGVGRAMVKRANGDLDFATFQEDFNAKALSYGLNVSILLRGPLDLQVQYRGLVFFPDDDLAYVMPDGEVRTQTVKNLATSNLMVGIGIHLGRR